MTATTAISPSVTFGGQTGSIALSLLDTNFTQIATFLNSANNYSNYLTDTGAANAIVVTTPTSITATYTAGLMLVVKVVAANTGATTINVNSLGLKNVTYPNAGTLSANALLAGSLAVLVYDGTSFILLAAANLGYVTFTGTETLTNKTLTNPTVNNYTEGVVIIGNTGTSKTIDLTNGTVQTATLTGNCTFTMPTVAAGKSFILILSTGAGSYTATFTSVKFPSNTAPTITTTASRWDILTFVSDGTNWYGNYAQAYQ
jgi:hypothetical protein